MSSNILIGAAISILIAITFFFVAISGVSNNITTTNTIYYDYCYQETANASSGIDGDCSQAYDGTYAFTGSWGNTARLIDGNWSSFSSGSGLGDSYLYMNYTKPSGANASSLWQVKDGSAPPQTVNLSVSCWNQDPLQLRALSHVDVNPSLSGSAWECWNGASWSTLRSRIGVNNIIYEDAMWWHVPFEDKNALSFISDNKFMLTILIFIIFIFIIGFLKATMQ